MNYQAVEGIANANPPGLGVVNYLTSLLTIAVFIKIGVADTGAGLNDRNFRISPDKIDQTPASLGIMRSTYSRALRSMDVSSRPGGRSVSIS